MLRREICRHLVAGKFQFHERSRHAPHSFMYGITFWVRFMNLLRKASAACAQVNTGAHECMHECKTRDSGMIYENGDENVPVVCTGRIGI